MRSCRTAIGGTARITALNSIPNSSYNTWEISALRTGFALSTPGGGGLAAEEAWGIDKKLDDGLASTGFVLTARDSSTTVRDVANACVTNKWDQPSSDYVLTDTAKNCRMIFLER